MRDPDVAKRYVNTLGQRRAVSPDIDAFSRNENPRPSKLGRGTLGGRMDAVVWAARR